MKNVTIRITRRRVFFAIISLLIIGLIAVSAYYFMQIKGLKDRVTQLENNYNGLSSLVPYDDMAMYDGQNSGISYDVTSIETKNVRVEDMEAYNMGMSPDGEPSYESKDVKVIKVKIVNNSETVYTFDGYGLQAQTKEGELLPPLRVHPDDAAGKTNFVLAPGGTAEGYLYVEGGTQEIVGLYDTMYSTSVKID